MNQVCWCVSIYVNIHSYIYIYLCIFVYMYLCIYPHIHTYIHIYMCICVCVCVHVFVRVYVFIHTVHQVDAGVRSKATDSSSTSLSLIAFTVTPSAESMSADLVRQVCRSPFMPQIFFFSFHKEVLADSVRQINMSLTKPRSMKTFIYGVATISTLLKIIGLFCRI